MRGVGGGSAALARRLAGHLIRGLAMIWVVTTVTFVIIRKMPGDPVRAKYEELIQQGVSPDAAQAQAALIARMRPGGSLWEQYLDYMGSLLQFDLGKSIRTGLPVTEVIGAAAKWTILPVLIGVLLSFSVGVALGVFAALKRKGALGEALTVSGTLIQGLPDYVLALALGAIFTTLWPILPHGGSVDIMVDPGFNGPYIASLAAHATLPILTYALSGYGGWILAMRSSVVTVLGDDFILASELRGLKRGRLFLYVARNAILPLFTIFALSLATVFGGALFIEQIFTYPGLGTAIVEAVRKRDFTVMGGVFLMLTIAIIIANIIADILYTLIDPRVRRSGEKS